MNGIVTSAGILMEVLLLLPLLVAPANVFREYIGAEFNDVKFSDVPINPNVEEFHFLLSFAIDFDSSRRSFTNGVFNIFWDSDNLSPSAVAAIRKVIILFAHRCIAQLVKTSYL